MTCSHGIGATSSYSENNQWRIPVIGRSKIRPANSRFPSWKSKTACETKSMTRCIVCKTGHMAHAKIAHGRSVLSG